jgi:hypothetical protein
VAGVAGLFPEVVLPASISLLRSRERNGRKKRKRKKENLLVPRLLLVGHFEDVANGVHSPTEWKDPEPPSWTGQSSAFLGCARISSDAIGLLSILTISYLHIFINANLSLFSSFYSSSMTFSMARLCSSLVASPFPLSILTD